MNTLPESGQTGDVPPWLAEYRRQKDEQAQHWLALGHPLDEDGWHDEDECRKCLETKTVINSCKCGACCRLIIEVDLEDAEREPQIKEKGSPLLGPPINGEREVTGYYLNSKDNEYACVFLDTKTDLCRIYNTRPLLCRLFDCDGEDREHLIEIGFLERDETGAVKPKKRKKKDQKGQGMLFDLGE